MESQIGTNNITQNGDDLYIKIQELTAEKEKIQEEFNIQRARMKDLFLQKEAELIKSNQEKVNLNDQIIKLKNELDDCKSQLLVDSMTLESNFEVEKRKAEEEIATLQRLVHETVEESNSLYGTEMQNLHEIIETLKKEIVELKKEKSQSPHHTSQEQISLAPSQVFNALTKGLKKLGADSFSSQESDEGLKKPQKDAEVLQSLLEPLKDQIEALKEKLRATDVELQKCIECGHHRDETQEDTEVIQSLLEPLKDQIEALKEKLRATDEELQKCIECGHHREEFIKSDRRAASLNATTATNTSFENQKNPGCEMCSNYEAQLVQEQKMTKEMETKVANAVKAAERHKEELLKEIGFRKDMEEKWNEKNEEHKKQVAELTRATECTEQDLRELRQYFNLICSELKMSLGKLTHERETIQQELTKLQKVNDNLVGKFAVHSQVLQSEVINLPNTVEELHELVLKNHQEIIIAKMGKEAAEDTINSLQSDIKILKDRITNEQHERKAIEEDIKLMRKQFDHVDKEKKRLLATYEKLSHSEKANLECIQVQNAKVTTLSQSAEALQLENNELKIKISSLQHELDNTEAVQQDFVRLSQNLQVQLEKIRGSDTEVRWQFEEDVDKCPSCHSNFASSKYKHHCRHCGQIFCPNCLNKVVLSGPNRRPSKVCDVCHTLLVKSSAPYFSEAAPMTE